MDPSGIAAAADLGRLLGTREPSIKLPSDAVRARGAGTRAAVGPERLRDVVERLPGPRSRLHAPAAMALAERLVADALEADGWTVERSAFHLVDEPGVLDTAARKVPAVYPSLDGANLIAVREGATSEAIVAVAHLDTVRDSPGADDNGAAVAALLETGRLLGGAGLARTVVLAFPDFEEIGVIGSRILAAELAGRWDVRGTIVLDCVGFRSREQGSQAVPAGLGLLYPGQVRRLRDRSRAGDFVAVLHRGSSTRLAGRFAAALEACTGRRDAILLRDAADLPGTGHILRRLPATRNFGRSDHSRFWERGLPAILLTDMANFRNPHYHRPSDTPETLDIDFVVDVTAALLLTIESAARPVAAEAGPAPVAAAAGGVGPPRSDAARDGLAIP